MQECGPESQSTQAILKQIGHKSYIYLEFHFCILLRHPRSYISELATAVFTEVLFVLQHHSIGLTCLAKCVGFGQCLDKPAAMEGFSATRGQKNHRKNRCATNFVQMMLGKLWWLSSLWRVADRSVSHNEYSCQPHWWILMVDSCSSLSKRH